MAAIAAASQAALALSAARLGEALVRQSAGPSGPIWPVRAGSVEGSPKSGEPAGEALSSAPKKAPEKAPEKGPDPEPSQPRSNGQNGAGEGGLGWKPSPKSEAQGWPMAGLSPLGLAYVGLAAALVKALASAGAAFAQKRLASRAGDAERRAAASALLGAGAREPVAATNAALALATRELELAVEAGLLGALKALIALVPLALALVLLSPTLALALALALGPVYGLLAKLRSRLRRALGRAQALAERLHGQVDDVVRHLDVHRSFGQGPRALRILSEGAEEASRAASRAEASRAALSGGNEALAALGIVVAVAAAGAGLFSFAEVPLVPAAALVLLAYRPLRDLGDARAFAERGALAYERLDAIAGALRAEEARDVSGEKRRALPCEQNLPMCMERTWTPAPVEVKGVVLPWNRSRGGATSFRLEPGEVAVLTGSTGSGKTTLLRILLGLEPAPRGASIRYGDEELGGRGAGPSERPFGWVPQEAPLIAGTVLENVRLGRPGASEAEALAALEAVGGASLAARGAERLEAGGPTLSGGERQLVAIARALVSAQPVLLLDEPTSGLDDASAARVLAALSALRGHRTLLLVTHRPEPASIADRILHLG